jgi:hypothetical protein
MRSSRRALAWSAAVAVPALVGAAVLVPMAASGAVDLPDKTPEELLEFAAASEVDALSGTIEQTSELGLPDVEALLGPDDAEADAGMDDLLALITGSHTAKVYLDGRDARLQVLDQLAERNVYVDGDAGTIWYVDSESASAVRFVLPSEAELDQLKAEAKAEAEAERAPLPGDAVVPTPDQMLYQALAALEESTEVTVGTDARVAGREVYELILAPRTDDTLVGEVRVAIDGETGVALAASVTARGAGAPAFEVAFTQVDFAAPDASVFAFEPAEGVTVTEERIPLPHAGDHDSEMPTDAAAPVVLGEGWSAVVELPNSSEAGADVFSGLDSEQRAMLESVTSEVEGGRVLQTSLMTVLITDDGRVLAGAVPADRLVEAAQTGR